MKFRLHSEIAPVDQFDGCFTAEIGFAADQMKKAGVDNILTGFPERIVVPGA